MRAAEALILPGVGHFGQLMRTLSARGLLTPLAESISRGTPLLGICLGLQALFQSSAEAPDDASEASVERAKRTSARKYATDAAAPAARGAN